MVSLLLPRFPQVRPWFFFLLLSGIGLAEAQAQEAYRLNDGGKTRDFVVAADEIQVVNPGVAAADLKARVEGSLAGATVRSVMKGQALVGVPARVNTRAGAVAAAALSRAVAGAEVEAVLYPPAAVRSRENRRVATADVLVQVPAGETAASLSATAGAKTVQPTTLPNRVMLHFTSGFDALDAAKALKSRGLNADVQLRRQLVPRFVPNDAFFANQWHLRNTGQGGGVRGMDANVVDAWNITTGSGVTVCVVDDGLQTGHPDLQPNCPPISSGFHHDFNGGDNDPEPVNDLYHEDQHGTSVGGVAAGKGNNSIGISGSAPDAQLVGIRLISEGTTDSQEASALYWHPTGLTVGVSNNSWGPVQYYAGAGPITKQALADAATLGRGGKGQITLFAGGNSQQASQGSRDANADSFANSRYVVAVGAVNNYGTQSVYSQRGANLLVSAPSNDTNALGIWTTDVVGDNGYNPASGGQPSIIIDPARAYTNSFGGTSSATPLVSGCVALMLAENPNLGWRDVHEILAATAVKLQPADSDWVTNGGGFKFNHRYGGGMVNAAAAVVRGKDWDNLGAEQMQTQSATGLPVAIPETSTGISTTFDFSAGPNLRVERAEIVLKMTHAHRSDVEITLTSPSGTKTILSQLRAVPSSLYDDDTNIEDNGAGWTFTTTHSWGENSSGTWTLTAKDLRSGTTGTLDSVTVRLYGTTAPSERVAFAAPVYNVTENSGSATVRVNRVGSAGGAFSVDVITSALGTATVGPNADFDAVTTTLDFAAGESFKDVVVPIHTDSEDENTETIYLLLKNPTGVALGGTPLAAIKVADVNVPTVTLVATDSSAGETLANKPSNPGVFVLSRTNADPTPLTVNLSISGTASAADYQTGGLPTTVTIPADASSITLPIFPMDDGAVEDEETLTVGLLAGNGYLIGNPNTATVTITDNDVPRIQVSAPSGSVAENTTAPFNFTVSRDSADPAHSLTVNLTAGGTAQPGIKYVALPTQVDIPAGQISVLVPLQLINDTVFSGSKTVTLNIAPGSNYIEGFTRTATVKITEDDFAQDTIVPTVKIVSPKAKTRIDAPVSVQISGTAGDNLSVARVVYSLNGGASLVATGTTAWNAAFTAAELAIGLNTVVVHSEDGDQNTSKEATVTFNYVQHRNLSLDVTAGGTVPKGFPHPVTVGVSQTASLDAGVAYTIEAKPDKGFVFAGWSDGVTSPSRVLSFTMPNADLHLLASFVPDPFNDSIKGTYTGLVRTAAFDFASCGLLQATVNAKGSCTGKLFLGGAKLVFKGEFSGAGEMRTRIVRKGAAPLDLDLTIALAGSNRTITGTVTDAVFTANVDAARAAFSKAAPYPLVATHPKAESYNFKLSPPGNPTGAAPRGSGHGSFTVDASGNVKWVARLRDGTKASGAVPLKADFSWPFYASLYKNRGLALGEFSISKVHAIASVSGTLDWFKAVTYEGGIFPAGFKLEAETAAGCLYTPPAKGAAYSAFGADAFSSGTIVFKDGNLASPAPFTRVFTCGPDNNAVITEGNPRIEAVLKISAAKGTFTGSFVDQKFVYKKTAVKFEGVILQNASGATGDFLGIPLSGGVVQTGTVTIDLE